MGRLDAPGRAREADARTPPRAREGGRTASRGALLAARWTPLGAPVSDDPTSPYSVVPPQVVPGANVFEAFIKNGTLSDPGDDLVRFTGAFLAHTEGQGDVASVMLEPLLKDPSRATGVVLDAAAGFGSADPIFAQSQRRDLTRALRESAIKKDKRLWNSQLALAL